MPGLGREMQQHETEWLSLISYQLRVARDQSEMPPPVNSLAISSLHDAVESMLSLVVEALGAPVKNRADFLQLFDAVDGALPDGASIAGFRTAANALNQSRVGFKHYGNRPSDHTLARHMFNGEELISEICRSVFDVSLDEVSLLAFIRNSEVRRRLEQATSAKEAGNLRESTQYLWLAFDELIRDFESTKSWTPMQSLFSTKPTFSPMGRDLDPFGRFGKYTVEWLENLDRWVRMLAIGVDTRRYAYFEAHTPVGYWVMSGDVHFSWRDEIEVSESVVDRCHQFVVDTALALAADDFTFDAWAARQAAGGGMSASWVRFREEVVTEGNGEVGSSSDS